jgi:hypothetical protein
MNEQSRENRELAKYAASAFSADRPPIFQYWDNDHSSQIHVMEAADRPEPGITSYSTIGLSEYPIFKNGEVLNLRTEFVGACDSRFEGFGNIIATSAFCIVNSKWFCAPGTIFPDVVRMHDLSSTLSDVYFTVPFLWAEQFKALDLGQRKVAWLLMVPISRAETEFARKNGPVQLEKLLEERQVDVCDLNRPSVV